MLVAISGSQGSGKSTLTDNMAEYGYPIIERKTSRSILTEWNVKLDEVNSDPTLTIKFQEEILRRKVEDEKRAVNSSSICFTERSFADLFTYALVSLGKHNEFSNWLNDYYKLCIMYNQDYSLVWYLRAGMFNVDHDGTRGSNHHYSRMVDITMLDFTKQMVHPSRLSIIETPDIEQRVQIIVQQTNALLGK